MGFSNLLVERGGAVTRITLNRPDKMNPLDRETVQQLQACFREADAEPSIRIVVLTGAGKAFSAGGDLEGYLTLYRDAAAFRQYLHELSALLDALERSSTLVLAAVNGYCVAGGLELLLACDLAIASEEARIGDGHLNFGQLPGGGGSQRLPRVVGVRRAKELILTGRLLDGREAERIGLVDTAVAAAELDRAVDARVADLLAKSPAGLRGAKYLVNEGLRGPLEAGLALEMAYVHQFATSHHDATEGLLAFKEKRAPKFAGP